MKHWPRPERRFLFLQGPPGPFFRQLGEELRQLGFGVHRINLNGGDFRDWRDADVNYRGTMRKWPRFVDDFIREQQITDLILYGDCRPMHMAAHGMAKLRQINIHVLEEGYIRPNWMTFEPDGVNGNSTLNRDPEWLLAEAAALPPLPELPPITASFRRRARDSYWHYHWIVVGKLMFPFYRSHRPGMIIVEGFGWLHKFRREKHRKAMAERVLAELDDAPFFLFPLQLSADYQIRKHSPFPDMESAVEHVFESFARCAPPGVRLIVKEHPLDCGFLDWERFVGRMARRFGIADRVRHIDGGDLEGISRQSRGLVCVNSTSGTLALAEKAPVMVLGDALYDIDRITHQGLLDDFWVAPQAPDPAVFEAFRRVLHDRCLIRGGTASKSATKILIRSMLDRLLHDPAHLPLTPPPSAGAVASGVTVSG